MISVVIIIAVISVVMAVVIVADSGLAYYDCNSFRVRGN